MSLDSVCNSVNSMQLSKTKQRTQKGLGKPPQSQLEMERKDKMILDGNTISGLPPTQAELEMLNKEHRVYLSADANEELLRDLGDVDDDDISLKNAHIRFLEQVVGSLAPEKICHSYIPFFTVDLEKEEAEQLAGMDEVFAVLPPEPPAVPFHHQRLC